MSKKRSVYDVTPNGDQWRVKERGAERAVGVFETKSTAVARATAASTAASRASARISKAAAPPPFAA